MAPARAAFSETSDPRAYVARPAVESVLAALEQWAADRTGGASIASLTAPPGLGKTFLLRLVESRLASGSGRARGLYLPYAGLALPDLSAWVHGLLGQSPPDKRPVEGLDADQQAIHELMALGSGAGSPLILLIDDADSMPLETARHLHALPDRGSPLRLALALNDGARAMRLRAVLDERAPLELLFQEPMSEAETRDYLRSRMSWAGVSEAAIARLESQAASRIHALSGGLPRHIHRLATSLLESDPDPTRSRGRQSGAPEAVGPWQDAEWLGQPFDEGDD